MGNNEAYIRATRQAMKGVTPDGQPTEPLEEEVPADSGGDYKQMRDAHLKSLFAAPGNEPPPGDTPHDLDEEYPGLDVGDGEPGAFDGLMEGSKESMQPEGDELESPAESAIPGEEAAEAGAPSAKPGTYGAEGDPYQYRVNADGSVTLVDGPTGKGMTLKNGAAFSAIMGQITNGTLKPGAEPKAPPAAPPMSSGAASSSRFEGEV